MFDWDCDENLDIIKLDMNQATMNKRDKATVDVNVSFKRQPDTKSRSGYRDHPHISWWWPKLPFSFSPANSCREDQTPPTSSMTDRNSSHHHDDQPPISIPTRKNSSTCTHFD